jgi:hypothetical protein
MQRKKNFNPDLFVWSLLDSVKDWAILQASQHKEASKMKQGQILQAKVDFIFKAVGGRNKAVKVGALLIVTSSSVQNSIHGGALLGRKSSAKIGVGDWFSFQQIEELFGAAL